MTDWEFLRRFFAPPNTAWLGLAEDHPASRFLAPFLGVSDTRGEAPLILPRAQEGVTRAYVICWDVDHAARLRPLLEAAVAHNLAIFDPAPCRLNEQDPIDRSVLDLVGRAATYVIPVPKETKAAVWASLRTMIEMLRARPIQSAKRTRSTRQLLKDFELALSLGQAQESGAILDELRRQSGLGLENLTYLEIRRLSRLGMDSRLLSSPQIEDLLVAEPPILVIDAILASWYRSETGATQPVGDRELDAIVDSVKTGRPDIALLVRDGLPPVPSLEARCALAVISIARGDSVLLAAARQTATDLPTVILDRLRDSVPPAVEEALQQGPLSLGPVVDEWSAWARGLRDGSPDARKVDPETLNPPWRTDEELAEVLEAWPDDSTGVLGDLLAAFLQVDQSPRPAWRSSRVLLRRLLLEERFDPQGLGATRTLLEWFLMSGPEVSAYAEVLEDVASFAPRWVSPQRPEFALDLAEVVALEACPDADIASSFVAVLLERIYSQNRVLSRVQSASAQAITDDLGLGWQWALREDEVADGVPQACRGVETILLYSMNQRVLDRVRNVLLATLPGITIHLSSDKAGNADLRRRCQSADLIVLATQCATHAATGFITDNAKKARVLYANGAGSGSMLKALEVI